MRTIRVRRLPAVVLLALCCGMGQAFGHGAEPGARLDPGDMQIGSTAARDGRLVVVFDFTAPVRASFAGSLGSLSTFSAAAPGFDAPVRRDVTEGIMHRLLPGTRVWIELVENDAGRTAIKVRDVLLARPGDRAFLGTHGDGSLHYHPEYQLVLDGPDGEFGEGRVAFRLLTDAPGYEPSPAYALTVTNGYLPAFTYDGGRFDAAGLRCHRALASQRSTALRTQAALLERCAGALPECGEAAGDCMTPAGEVADPVRIAADVAAARAAARDAIVAACGGRLQPAAVDAHLGMAGCRLERAMRSDPAASEPACGAVAARHAARFLLAKERALASCALAFETDKAREAAGLPVAPAIARNRCAYARGSDGEDQTALGRIARARRRAARAIRRACAEAAAPAVALGAASCGADDVASAGSATLKSDFSPFSARATHGSRRLPEYFPCMRAGYVGERPGAPEDER